MDMVFVYEDKIAQDVEGNYYTGGSLPQLVFDRYLQHFDHITILMRKADVNPHDMETLSRMNRLDMEHMDVVLLPDLNAGVKSHFDPRVRTLFKKTILDLIHPGIAVIVRVPSVSGTIAADYCHKKGIPYLAEAVGCPWDSLWNHSIKGKIMAPAWWKSMRRTLRNADYSVYVTSEFLQSRYPTIGKSVAISDVELQPMDESVLEKRLEKIQKQSGKLKLATAAAVNAAYKGQQFVIEALSNLKKKGITNIEYHLVGGGDPSVLQNLAGRMDVSNQVFFEGTLPHDAMFAWLDEMDIYIQPSLQEGLPRSVVEAMSRGLPVLGARTGGIPELLGEDCIFPRKGVEEIAQMLARISPEQMTTMSRNNYEKAKHFQKELLEQKRYDFYSAFATDVKEKQ